jgi:hypothetical protein
MIQAYIGGEEVVSNKEFTIHEELLNTSSTILNNCYPKSWETTKDYVNNFYYPKDYSNCEIYNNGNLIFAGIVKNSGEISLNPYDPKYCSLQILDYKTLLSEGQTLDYVIPEGTINDAIDSVIAKISDYGFVKGNIILENGNEQMGAYSTLDKTPYDVFQYLAEISGSKWFTRMIDSTHTAIDFYSPSLMNKAPDIEYTKEYFENKSIVNMEFSFSGADYRNKQVILSDQVFSSIDTIDTIITINDEQTFITSAIVGKLKNVYVNGVSKTIGTSGDKELGIYADFYYKIGTNEIESSSRYAIGSEIKFIYTSLVKGRQVVSNEDEITRISTQISRNGTIARYETRNDTSSSKELARIADSYLRFKGKAEIDLTITTKDFDIFELGQQTYFNAPIDELKGDYLVKSKDIQITKVGTFGVVFYTYVLSNSFDTENAINFFDNQRRKRSGNLEENEFITRNIDVDNEAEIIFENLSIEEIDIDTDNVLNAPLNAPFVE